MSFYQVGFIVLVVLWVWLRTCSWFLTQIHAAPVWPWKSTLSSCSWCPPYATQFSSWFSLCALKLCPWCLTPLSYFSTARKLSCRCGPWLCTVSVVPSASAFFRFTVSKVVFRDILLWGIPTFLGLAWSSSFRTLLPLSLLIPSSFFIKISFLLRFSFPLLICRFQFFRSTCFSFRPRSSLCKTSDWSTAPSFSSTTTPPRKSPSYS